MWEGQALGHTADSVCACVCVPVGEVWLNWDRTPKVQQACCDEGGQASGLARCEADRMDVVVLQAEAGSIETIGLHLQRV